MPCRMARRRLAWNGTCAGSARRSAPRSCRPRSAAPMASGACGPASSMNRAGAASPRCAPSRNCSARPMRGSMPAAARPRAAMSSSFWGAFSTAIARRSASSISPLGGRKRTRASSAPSARSFSGIGCIRRPRAGKGSHPGRRGSMGPRKREPSSSSCSPPMPLSSTMHRPCPVRRRRSRWTFLDLMRRGCRCARARSRCPCIRSRPRR